MSTIRVREYRPEDAASVAVIHTEAFAPWIDSLPAVFGWRHVASEDVRVWSRASGREILVGLLDGEVAGYALVARRDAEIEFLTTDVHGGQSRLAVWPALRRRGVGRALVEAAIRDFTGWAWMGAYGDNDDATRFLTALGFAHGRLPWPGASTVIPDCTDDSVLATHDLTVPLPEAPAVPGLRIREIREDDVDPMRRVFAARPGVFGPDPSREDILEWMRSGWGETLLVAEIDGQVVGCMEHRPTGVLGIPGVLPEFRRRGVGTAIMIRLLEVMRGKGLRTALADTGWFDDAAIRLYESLGFETSLWLRSWMRRIGQVAGDGTLGAGSA